MLVTLLAACGEKPASSGTTGGNSNNPGSSNSPSGSDAVQLSTVFTEEQLPIALKGQVGSLFVKDGRVYYLSTETVPDPTNMWAAPLEMTTSIISLLPDGTDEQVVWTHKEVNGETEETFVEHLYPSIFRVDGSGTIWMIATTATDDRTDPDNVISTYATNLMRIDASGAELSKVDLLTIEGGSAAYAQNLAFDAAGNLYLQGGQSVLVFSAATGQYLTSVKETTGYISSLTTDNNGKALYITAAGMMGGATTVKTIDSAAFTADAGVNYTGSKYFMGIYPGSGKYAFYFTYQDTMCAFDTATGTDVIVINYLDSDIDGRTIGNIAPMGDGTFIVMKTAATYGATPTLYKLAQNTDPSVAGKTTITLGAMYIDDATKNQILEFNKASKTTRIVLRDYSTYNTATDYNKGMAQMDADIIAGRAPDIISLQGLQASKYTNKGVFADMYPLLDADPNISRSDLFENVLTALSTDGKLFHIAPRISVMTLAGKASIFSGDHITTPQLNDIKKNRPDSDIVFGMTSSSWLQFDIMVNNSNYVDWVGSKTSFDSQQFIDTLYFCKNLPAEIDYSNMDFSAMQTMYSDEKALLSFVTLSGIRVGRDQVAQFGEDVNFIGYPVESGSGNIITVTTDYAISSFSQHQDLAWEFIATMLTPENKSAASAGMFGGGGGDIPLNRHWLEEQAAIETTPVADRDFEKGVTLNVSWGGYSMPITYTNKADVDMSLYTDYELSQAEADAVLNAIKSATKIMSSNDQIWNIISEETSAYWAGQKSAEETAKVIQSRASIFVSENG
jgi:ABC-type glycerol-3-phosphate transport system substrate-binding protein